jgi:protein transport protein SEC9
MGKFGFGKKSDDDDGNRTALFGSKKGSSAPSDNPYAQQANDPYLEKPMTGAQASYRQYQQAPIGGGLPNNPRNGPRGGYGGSMNRTGSHDSAEPAPPPYSSGQQRGGYGSDRYGASGGYGSNQSEKPGAYGSRGPGGYGGLGRADGDEADPNRDALLGGARERREQAQQSGQQSGGDFAAGSSSSANYGGYGERRELTAEEQEEEEVADIRRQIKETKLASANSAENSERIASQAVETALGTYARLGAQHERLNYTESLLDKASMSTREAEGQTKKLKSLNRSMFAVHPDNPFTKKKRNAELEASILDEHRADRDLREATRKAGWQANQHMEQGFKEIDQLRSKDKWQRASAAEKNKYQFEDDSEDEEAENRIDDAMARTANHVSTLNSVAKMMGKEIDSQNEVIDRLGGKVSSIFFLHTSIPVLT